ncbi:MULTISPECIES: hypothetical protein [unclassified Moraxella]|uniref:hypothetical protein n=1 Tax=unclassified Moraxella TaxID=2685852 RepID=UPI003AF63783
MTMIIQTTLSEFQQYMAQHDLADDTPLLIAVDGANEVGIASSRLNALSSYTDVSAKKLFQQFLSKLSPQAPTQGSSNQNTVEPIAKKQDFSDLANSEVFGMWKDRDDIGDSTEYIRKLRRQEW